MTQTKGHITMEHPQLICAIKETSIYISLTNEVSLQGATELLLHSKPKCTCPCLEGGRRTPLVFAVDSQSRQCGPFLCTFHKNAELLGGLDFDPLSLVPAIQTPLQFIFRMRYSCIYLHRKDLTLTYTKLKELL